VALERGKKIENPSNGGSPYSLIGGAAIIGRGKRKQRVFMWRGAVDRT